MVTQFLDEKHFIPQSLRDYQREALDAVYDAWSRGVKALIAVATGGGKTSIAAQALVETIDPERHRALVIGHTKEIVDQCYSRIENQFGGRLGKSYMVPGVMMAPGIGIVMGENDMADARVVVAMRQSLHAKRLKSLLATGRIDVLVIDEAHHALQDNTYGAIVDSLIEANPDMKVLGLTATPKRTDRKALGTVFDEIVYQWLIPDGIAAGYLTPVTRVKVSTQVNLSDVKTSRGDYSSKKMVSILNTANWLDLVQTAYDEHIGSTGRKTLAFMPSVEMSKRLASRLSSNGVSAVHLDGETPTNERVQILRDYASGHIQVVSNMAVLTEGFDAPATSAILLGRPTRSKSLFTQIVGRGLRPYPGKENCILLDVTVQDTKALEIGSLLGRMVECKACGSDYLSGLSCCPVCGELPPVPESRSESGDAIIVPTTSILGNGIESSYESLFEKTFAAWHMGSDGYLSCALGYDCGVLVIMPPVVDQYYRLALVPKDRNNPVRLLNLNEDLASLIAEGDKYASNRELSAPATTQKDARWRSLPPTSGQLSLLRKLKIKSGTINRGTASQLISHTLYVKRAATEPWQA